MAEIQIERKERSAWPWVLLGIIVIALLAWWLIGRAGTDDAAVVETPTERSTSGVAGAIDLPEGAPGEVNDFLRFAHEAGERPAMGLDHRYTADGLTRLAAALGALGADRMTTLQPKLDSLRRNAEALQRSAQSTEHSRQARDAFMSAFGIMDQLRQQEFPTVADAVSQVREAAQAIETQPMLLDQEAAVRRFFDRAAAAVRSMVEA